MIRYSHITPNSFVDGPGSRTVVFLKGCSIACRGCQNQQLWPHAGGTLTTPIDLAEEILSHGNPNITISGGEMSEQLEEVFWLLSDLRHLARLRNFGPLHIIAYTGRTFEWLIENRLTATMRVFRLVDVLVDGPFILEQDDPLITWRGSRNQRPIDVKATLATGDLVVLDWTRPEIVIDADGNLHMPVGLASGFQPAGDLKPSRRCGQTR